MKSISIKTIIWWLSVSLFLVLLGHFFVQQRVVNGPTRYLTIRNDALHYIAMAEGDFQSASSPFRYRPLVPLLARVLPLTAVDGLRLVTYGSLLGFYFLCLAICHALGIRSVYAVFGLLTVWATPSHLYNYHNPFLTDGLGLTVIAALLLALLVESALVYLIVILIGITIRENAVFLSPGWFLIEIKWKGVTIIALALVAMVTVRLIIGPYAEEHDIVTYLKTTFHRVGRTQNPLSFLKAIYKTWHARWLLLPVGLLLVSEFRWSP